MTKASFIAAAFLAIQVCPVAAEDGNVAAAATTSRMAAIAHFCPKIVPTDSERALKIAEAFTVIGKRQDGAEWLTKLEAETGRRIQEISAKGKRAWCKTQRKQLKDRTVFPDKAPADEQTEER